MQHVSWVFLVKNYQNIILSGVPILGVSIAFALSMYSLYLTLYGFKLNETVYTWLASGGYIFEVGFLIDTLSAVMMVIVTFISLMVHIYTISYMKDDTGFSYYLGDIAGQIFVFFILTVAAAEAAIGLAIIIIVFRNNRSIDVEDINRLKG